MRHLNRNHLWRPSLDEAKEDFQSIILQWRIHVQGLQQHLCCMNTSGTADNILSSSIINLWCNNVSRKRPIVSTTVILMIFHFRGTECWWKTDFFISMRKRTDSSITIHTMFTMLCSVSVLYL